MAGFNTLGSTVNTNVGGSFNPSFSGQIGSGQFGPPGFGIQPPRISNPYNVDALSLSAGSRPTTQSPFFAGSAQTYYPGPDASAQHQANVAMAQQGFGNMGLTDQSTPGTSYSSYGVSPQNWQTVMRYLANPQGSNAGDYQNMVNTIRNSMNGNPMFSSWLPDQFGPFSSDFLLRFGGPYGVFQPNATQNLQIPTTVANGGIPGVRNF